MRFNIALLKMRRLGPRVGRRLFELHTTSQGQSRTRSQFPAFCPPTAPQLLSSPPWRKSLLPVTSRESYACSGCCVCMCICTHTLYTHILSPCFNIVYVTCSWLFFCNTVSCGHSDQRRNNFLNPFYRSRVSHCVNESEFNLLPMDGHYVASSLWGLQTGQFS